MARGIRSTVALLAKHLRHDLRYSVLLARDYACWNAQQITETTSDG